MGPSLDDNGPSFCCQFVPKAVAAPSKPTYFMEFKANEQKLRQIVFD